MKKIVENNFNKILSIFILMGPILDLITGIGIHKFNMNFTIGMIIRVLALLFIMFITIFVYDKKKNLIYYLSFFIYSIFYVVVIVLFRNSVGILTELQGLVRVFYFPLMLISLYSIKEEVRISKRLLVVTLSLYLLFIFVPNLLGLGFKSYEITKAGSLGFFNSANEISGIISILTPIMILFFIENKNKWYIILVLFIYLYVILSIGTKTPLLTLILTLVLYILWLWVKEIKVSNYKFIGVSFVVVLLSILLFLSIIPKTNFYKNIKTHMDYLKVDNIGDVLEKPKLIDHFIFSQRLTFLDKRQKLYNKSSVYEKFFGIGYLEDGKQTKSIEMDYFDIYYSHGLIGCILFFISYIYVLYNILRQRRKMEFFQYVLYISLFLILFLSLFTGHIITCPSVSIISVILIMMIYCNYREDVIF